MTPSCALSRQGIGHYMNWPVRRGLQVPIATRDNDNHLPTRSRRAIGDGSCLITVRKFVRPQFSTSKAIDCSKPAVADCADEDYVAARGDGAANDRGAPIVIGRCDAIPNGPKSSAVPSALLQTIFFVLRSMAVNKA
jgi:hypothetical protein